MTRTSRRKLGSSKKWPRSSTVLTRRKRRGEGLRPVLAASSVRCRGWTHWACAGMVLAMMEPPLEYIQRWRGEVVVRRLPSAQVQKLCQADIRGVLTRGCAYRTGQKCLVIVAREYELPNTVAHEVAHCGGWEHE
jgi:hypothetical protein